MKDVLDVRVAHDQRNTIALIRTGKVMLSGGGLGHIDLVAGEAAAEGEGWADLQLGGEHQGEDLQSQGGGGGGDSKEDCEKKHEINGGKRKTEQSNQTQNIKIHK